MVLAYSFQEVPLSVEKIISEINENNLVLSVPLHNIIVGYLCRMENIGNLILFTVQHWKLGCIDTC